MIKAIKTPSGPFTHDPDEINHSIGSFYSHPYTAEPTSDLTALKSYLSELNLSSLSNEDIEYLEVPLSLSELKELQIQCKEQHHQALIACLGSCS